MFNDDPDLLKKVITGEESRLYGYDIETKAQSSQCKCSEEPRPKKALQVWSNVKALITVFFDCNWVLHHEFLPQGRTVNKEYYFEARRRLRLTIWSNVKVLITVFFDCNWVRHHEFLSQGRTVNKEYYLEARRRMRLAIPRNCIELWKIVEFASR